MNLIKTQIPAICRLCVCTHFTYVSLATIGVCVFCAVYFGSRTFCFFKGLKKFCLKEKKINYLEFKNWKSSHATDMSNLTFAHPEDIFIFTRFTDNNPIGIEAKQILFAEDIEETIGYLRHIFLYDILNDALNDLNFDFKSPFDEKQNDAIAILKYWYKLGTIASQKADLKQLREFINQFNSDFSRNKNPEYEIHILDGADELRKFLISNFSNYENFDKKRLCNICSKEFFVGKKLKNYTAALFE